MRAAVDQLAVVTLSLWSLAAASSMVKFKDEARDQRERANYSQLKVTWGQGRTGSACYTSQHMRGKSMFSIFLSFSSFLPFLVCVHAETIKSIITKLL